MKARGVRMRLGVVGAVVVPLLALTLFVSLIISHHVNAPGTYTPPPPGKPVHAALKADRYIGVYEPGAPQSYKPVAKFAEATRENPGIALYYSSWWEPFQVKFANQAHAAGATPFVQMIPFGKGVSMGRLIAGQYDNYLRTFASQVRDYRHPVIVSFAPEADGYWYEWGWGKLRAAKWVQAWKHVVTTFRHEGADNVTWLWTMNRTSPKDKRIGPFQDYWPGSQYVDWIGLDGYYTQKNEDFRVVFGYSIGQIRKFAHKPILISETAVGPTAGTDKITQLFAGIKQWGLLGFVWFDKAQHRPPVHQDWRLEDSPADLAVFQREAKTFKAGQ